MCHVKNPTNWEDQHNFAFTTKSWQFYCNTDNIIKVKLINMIFFWLDTYFQSS